MSIEAVVAGSLEPFRNVTLCSLLELTPQCDVVLLPTAAVFSGMAQAALTGAQVLEASGAHVEALMIGDRAAANEAHFATRIAVAQWVVLLDGSALHARSTWRNTAVGDALSTAKIIAIGETATVIGDEMIDPRGGAPTTGLGLRSGAVFSTETSDEQLARTKDLLARTGQLVVLSSNGVVFRDNDQWFQWSEGGVAASFADESVVLPRFNSR